MSDNTVNEIKDRLNVADVIASYIPIKKAGASFKALCPFHNEKTPSMQISPQKQIWHCFGCGEGGDIFGFVMKYENVDFKQALKILADKAGVKLPEYRPANKAEEDEKDLLLRINSFTARFYHELLTGDARGKIALDYLSQRGLKKSTLDKWQIGFAPNDFHTLEQALQKKQVNIQEAIKAGVLTKNERGQIYDRFRGRITFPIFNFHNEIVGFSARILPQYDDGKSGKYINSPESPVYSKSKVLFGLNFAKTGIRKTNEAIIVEGQMDVISAHQAGFENIVASSGTALTQDQLALLGRLTKNLKFCFDSDQAGLIATRRAIENYLGQDFNIKIISLNGAKDADELIHKNPQLWDKAVLNAQLFLDFFIDKAFEHFASSSIEQKKQVAKDLLPLIKRLSDPLEQDHYLQILATRFGTIVNVLKQTMQKISLVNPKPRENIKTPVPVAAPHSPAAEMEKLVLGGMLSRQKFLNLVVSEGQITDFTNSDVQALVARLFAGQVLTADDLNSTLAKEALFMVELSATESVSPEAFQKDLTKAFFHLRLNSLKKQQQALTGQIRAAEQIQDSEKLKILNKQFAENSYLRIKYEKEL